MKIVVIGGSGLIGSKLVAKLREAGHDVVSASPNSGVNAVTGEGLAAALAGARVVVDVANSPSFEDQAVLEFFEASGRNLVKAEIEAGVGHHVALSVVGTERLVESGYIRAKIAQERIIKASPVPYSIVHSTQFFEFLGAIAQSATAGDSVRLSPAWIQPIFSDDVVAAMFKATLGRPLGATLEIAGPQRFPLSELVQRYLAAKKDPRKVIDDVHARYFGAELTQDMLIPGPGAQLAATTFDQWMSRQ
jgi:uncharacterized protein YbjT (DUF2867 family)